MMAGCSEPQSSQESDSAIIVVDGIEGISQDTLEVYFENERKAGGGDIRSITLLDGRAYIIFEEPTVAERVLARTDPIVVNEKTLRVTRPGNTDPFSIVVENIGPHVTRDSLLLFFESSRKCGGGIVKNIQYERGTGSAVITFQDQQVTKRVLKQPSWIHEKCEFRVLPLSLNNQSQSADPRVVVVKGVSGSTSQESIRLFFENERKSGGGDIDDLQYDQSKGTAVVTFTEEEVAARVIARKEPFVLDDAMLIVKRPYNIPEVDPLSVVVKNIGSNITKDSLTLFFESKRGSGGGPIKDVQYVKESGSAVVTFNDADVAQRVLTKADEEPLVFDGSELQVSRSFLEADKESEEAVDPRMILVEGISSSTSQKCLSLFFGNESRSGGGKVLDIKYDAGKGTAVVIFQDKQVATRVLSRKGPIKLDNNTLTVKKPHKAPEVDPYSINVQNIGHDTTKDSLDLFLDAEINTLGGTITDIEYEQGSGSAVVTFGQTEVVEQILRAAQTKALEHDGCELRLSRRELDAHGSTFGLVDPRMLVVDGVSSSTTKKCLTMFLENEKKSGGGKILDLRYERGEETATVVFKDKTVAARILARTEPLILDKSVLSIKPPPKPPEVDPFSLMVKNIAPDITKDSLELFLYSEIPDTECDIQSTQYEQGLGCAFVTFTDKEVVQMLLTRPDPLEYSKDCVLELAVCTVASGRGKSDADRKRMDARVLIIDGINDTTTKRCLTLFLQNAKKSGGGEIGDLQYEQGRGNAKVIFKKEQDASNVLQKSPLQLEGVILSARKPDAAVAIVKPLKDTAGARPDCGPDVRLHTLMIDGLKSTVKKDDLKRLLTKQKQLGGGEIQDIKIFTEKGKAIARYKSSLDLQKLQENNTLTIRSTACHMFAVDTSVEDSGRYEGPLAVLVTGISADTKEATIKMFFQNRRKSGGGDIANLYCDLIKGRAVVTFKLARVASNVWDMHQSEPLKLPKSDIDLVRLQSPVPPKFIFGPKERNKAFIIEAPSVTPDELEDYISGADMVSDSAASGYLDIKRIRYSYSGKTILLEFRTEPDFKELSLFFATTPLKEFMMTLQRVALPTRIQVHNIEIFDNCRDTLEMFFQESRQGGTESVAIEDINTTQQYAILDCEDPEVVQTIAQKKLKFADREVQVSPYYPDFGPIPLGYDSTQPWDFVPPPYVQSLHPDSHTGDHKYYFIETVPSVMDSLNTAGQKDSLFEVDWKKSSAEGLVVLPHSDYKHDSKLSSWEERSTVILNNFLDTIAVSEVSVLKRFMQEVKDEASKDSKYGDILVKIEEDRGMIVLVGWAQDVKQVEETMRKSTNKFEEQMSRSMKTIEEKLPLDNNQIAMVKKMNCQEELLKTSPSMTVEFSPTYEVVFKGLPTEIQSAKNLIFQEVLSRMVSERIRLTPNKCTLLKSNEVQTVISDNFHQASIVAELDVGPSDVTIYCLEKQKLVQASGIIGNLITEQSKKLEPENMSVLATDVWALWCANLLNEFKGQVSLEDDLTNMEINLTCLTEIYEKVSEDMRTFMEEQSVLTHFEPLEQGYFKLLKNFRLREIDTLAAKFKNCFVTIEAVDEDESGFQIKGTKHGLPHARTGLQEMIDGLVEHDQLVSEPGMPEFFRTGNGKEVMDALEPKHEFSYEILEAGQEKKSRRLRKRAAAENDGSVEEFHRVDVDGGFVVKILKGDITKLKVDIIVNAANTELLHGGGLAGAIAKAGGLAIQQECKKHVQRYGRLRTGQHFFGKESGNLPCKFIIHAVGPTWEKYGNNRNKENELYAAVFDSLGAAESNGVTSIALPALSTGIYEYPVDKATRTISEAVIEFLEGKPKNVKEISLVDVVSSTVNSFKQSFLELVGESRLKVIASHQQTHQRSPQRGPQTRPKAFSSRAPDRTPEIHSWITWQRGQTGNTIKTTSGITVQLKKSTITKEQVDVIVNTTNVQLDLSQGAVSTAILRAGGPIVQKECQEFAPKGITYGNTMRTSAGGIKRVKAIYHGVCTSWDGGNSKKILNKFIGNCLRDADSEGFQSIAFPAIGTGNLKFPADVVAEVMFEEFLKFGQQYPGTCLKDIRVILYAQDEVTVQALENHLHTLSADVEEATGHRQRTIKKPAHKPQKPAWMGGARKETRDRELDITVGPIRLVVKEGDITEEHTDAIVNSTNPQLDLTVGAVSQAIARKGGQRINDECQAILRIQRRVRGHAITGAGRLKCNKIIHLVNQGGSQLENTIYQTLKFADGHNCSSVSFPAIGTGAMQSDPIEMARAMVGAIEQFGTRDNPQSLYRVHITIFEHEMFKSITDAVERITQGSSQKPGLAQRTTDWFRSWGSGSDQTQQPQHMGYDSSAEEVTQHFVPGHREREPVIESLTIRIFALSQRTIDVVVQRINKLTEDATETMSLDQPTVQEVIKKLTEQQVDDIESLQHKYGIRVAVDRGRLNRITLTGPSKGVAACAIEANNILQEVQRGEDQVQKVEEMYTQVNWEYKASRRFTAYNKEINFRVESAYRRKVPNAEWETDDGDTFMIEFSDLVEINQTDNQQTPVRRRLLHVADGSISLPDDWVTMSDTDPYKLDELQSSSAEYQSVSTAFTKTHTPSSVVKVERVQNPALYKQYIVKKNDMDVKNPQGHTNERTLYHGTSEPTLKSINTSGFNRSYCGKNAVVIGNGVYFARDANYSAQQIYSPPDGNGHKHIYQCKVLTGTYTTGAGGMIAPPPKDPQIPNIIYDSVANDITNNPGIFVIFNDTQAYPEYLITFT